jgi:hypothetical protein
MPTPLIRNGTVIRGDSYWKSKHIDSKPDDVTPSREVAPIEEVTHVVEGFTSTVTITFEALEGEEIGPVCQPDTGYPILCAEDHHINQRACRPSPITPPPTFITLVSHPLTWVEVCSYCSRYCPGITKTLLWCQMASVP